MIPRHKVTWIDSRREPTDPPDPRWPNGIPVDLSNGGSVACVVDLDYPAPRCGAYLIECEACGLTVTVTTAGRADDPRSVKMPCMSRSTLQ